MTQDERLIPAGSTLDRSLEQLTQSKPYGKYDRYGSAPTDTHLNANGLS
jgi:hypothetical protein